jgi:D-ribose pyranose/furanose isomerase RbsD
VRKRHEINFYSHETWKLKIHASSRMIGYVTWHSLNWNEKIWYWRSFHKTAFLVRKRHEINFYSHETWKLRIHASSWMIGYDTWHSLNWKEKLRYWRSFHKTAFLVRKGHEINVYSHETWKLGIHASNWMIRYVTCQSSNWNEKIRYWRSFQKMVFLVRQTHEINFYSHEMWKLGIHASNWMIRYVTWHSSNWNKKIRYWRSFHKMAFLMRQTHEINFYSHETWKLAIHASNWMIRYVKWNSSNWNERIRYWRSFHKTAFLVHKGHEINFYSHKMWKLRIHASSWMIRCDSWHSLNW